MFFDKKIFFGIIYLKVSQWGNCIWAKSFLFGPLRQDNSGHVNRSRNMSAASGHYKMGHKGDLNTADFPFPLLPTMLNCPSLCPVFGV